MYEDLIKDLRNCFGTDSMFCDCDSCHYKGLVDDHDYSKCVETLGVEAADAIERLQKPQWIPVTERLPEFDTEVLVYAYNHNIWVWEYHGNAWEAEDGFYHEVDVVTHWMPLPEPPKDGET